MFDFHPYRQVYNRLLQLESIGHPLDKVELIIMGGTFPSQPICFQEWFITRCIQAMNDFGGDRDKMEVSTDDELDVPTDFRYLTDAKVDNERSRVRCVGMTFETRPDYSKRRCGSHAPDGCYRVELGVQTIYNFVYHRMERGHRVEDVVEANQVLRDSGLKVAMHFMPGLLSNPEMDLRIFRRVFSDGSFMPDMLKIYPCLATEAPVYTRTGRKGFINHTALPMPWKSSWKSRRCCLSGCEPCVSNGIFLLNS